ncbi:ATPase RavA stimulator ViaA [Vibrio sp. JC009]|uniref:ATPase RavA stimulator ViaA n=1 Tax=Vibrio sp. JC009 TaxID=2912314 RepID=UPI0023B0FEA5|nr:ATPase RavA stimulator ViaA [Vibrio sp. JC009]WED24346.1 ATPase RavA stimulator ViaA [Vibrio sp. JC009]
MLGADGLNLAMMVAESGIIDNAVNDLIGRSQLLMLPENSAIKASVKTHITKWRGRVTKRITKVCETERFQNELNLYQEVIYMTEEEFCRELPSIMQRFDKRFSFYKKANKLLARNKGAHNNPMFPHYFCEQWYESLSKSIKQAELAQLESDKEAFLADLYQRIETMKDIDDVTVAGEVGGVGRLWDMAGAKLTKRDVASLKKFAAFLKKNKELQQIAEKLGRMASEVDDPSLFKTPAEELKLVEEKSDEATDDIVGIHEGDDLSKMLPNETMFLAYPELEVVFYKHLVDKRLMNYKVKGKARTLRKVKSQKPESKVVDIEKGPFVICVDASGSMSGFPEQCAKAMAYALMQIALAEDRECYVILFSTEQITYELTKQDGLREASNFLSYQFHGGTEFEPVLLKSIELMHSEKYRNADLVVLSDFIAPKQPEDIMQQVQALQAKKNRFHAISLSRYGNPQLMEIFDHCWAYHPNVVNRLVKRW